MSEYWRKDSIKELKARRVEVENRLSDKIEKLSVEIAKKHDMADGLILDAFDALAVVFEDNLALRAEVVEEQARAECQILDAYDALAAVFEDNIAMREELAALRNEFADINEYSPAAPA